MLRTLRNPWIVAGVTFLVLLASAAFRLSIGVMVAPFEEDFGWSRSAISLAVSVNLVLYGITAPFAAALAALLIPRTQPMVNAVAVH